MSVSYYRQVKHNPQNAINELIIWKKNPLVVESEIYIYQWIQLLNSKFINGILGGSLDLAWLYIMNSVSWLLVPMDTVKNIIP